MKYEVKIDSLLLSNLLVEKKEEIDDFAFILHPWRHQILPLISFHLNKKKKVPWALVDYYSRPQNHGSIGNFVAIY
jgi:hypothetical protein